MSQIRHISKDDLKGPLAHNKYHYNPCPKAADCANFALTDYFFNDNYEPYMDIVCQHCTHKYGYSVLVTKKHKDYFKPLHRETKSSEYEINGR